MRKEQIEEMFEILMTMSPMYTKNFRKPVIHDDCPKLSMLQHSTLLLLIGNGKCTMNSLSEFHHIAKQQTTKLVESLERFGFIKREINPDNRREILVDMTPAGLNYMVELREHAYKHIESHLQGHTDEEIDHLLVEMNDVVNFFRNTKADNNENN